MIDIAKLIYREYALLPDGKRLNITGAVTAAGWSEGEGEISKRLSMTVANTAFGGKPLSSTIVPNTIVMVNSPKRGRPRICHGMGPHPQQRGKEPHPGGIRRTFQPSAIPGRPIFARGDGHKVGHYGRFQ